MMMNNKITYLLIVLVVFIAGLYTYSNKNSNQTVDHSLHELQNQIVLGQDSNPQTKAQKGLETISDAFVHQRSSVQVQASGKVKAILTADKKGSRHQRFILTLGNGLTVLVVHNIDLAPPIKDLKKGDTVQFNGEYEYNPEGGVIHWTHRDPKGVHENGWLKHSGKIYQ